jgi:hypothetical protein
VTIRRSDFFRGRRGPAGPLVFLRSKGQGEYEKLFEVADGWAAWPERQIDGVDDRVPVMQIEIEERADPAAEAQLAAVLKTPLEAEAAEAGATADSVAIEGTVYVIEREHTAVPTLEPRRWKLRAYSSEGRWQGE